MGKSTNDALRELYEEDKKVMMIIIIYGTGKRNREKSVSIGKKIIKAFKEEELIFRQYLRKRHYIAALLRSVFYAWYSVRHCFVLCSKVHGGAAITR